MYILILLMFIGLMYKASSVTLIGNETGRYLYESYTVPGRKFYCTYCTDDLSTSSQDAIVEYQERKCSAEDKFKQYENDREEKEGKLMPFCKQNKGIVPGCGPIPIKKGLRFEQENSDWPQTNRSRVYEVYIARCKAQLVLNTNRVKYRCGESRRWDTSPYDIECIQRSGTLDAENDEMLHYAENDEILHWPIIVAVCLLVMVVLAGIIVWRLKLHLWQKCRSSASESQPIPMVRMASELQTVSSCSENNQACESETKEITVTIAAVPKVKNSLKVFHAEILPSKDQRDVYRAQEGVKLVFASAIPATYSLSIKRTDNKPNMGKSTDRFMFIFDKVQKSDAGEYIYTIKSNGENDITGTFVLCIKERGKPDGQDKDIKSINYSDYKVKTYKEKAVRKPSEPEENDEELEDRRQGPDVNYSLEDLTEEDFKSTWKS